MPENLYEFQYGEYGNTEAIITKLAGISLQYHNFINKGTAFSIEEREKLGLDGALPPSPRSLENQVVNSAVKVDKKGDDIERFIYIRALFDRNATLAHALIKSNIERYMGIIYTPTVGLACQRYSSIFRNANGIHFYPGNIDKAESILRHYVHRGIRVAVVTDNQGILGIGDQGAGGIAICLGKLMLYTQGAGIAPWHCLPISLDVGTNNKELLGDSDYLGWRHERLTGDDYLRFVQRFAKAFRAVFPNALCQWEDFSKQNAFAIRDSYLHDLISFNDDIQGTGSITLAGVLTAMRIKKESLTDQVYLIHGAGAGGVGIAEQIETALIEEGLSKEMARARIFTLDSRGLVTSDRKLDPYKEKFAKDPNKIDWMKDPADGTLENVVRNEKVTVLIGTSGQAGCFTQEVIQASMANTDRPVILPLSNPTSMTEALPEDIYKWTDGKALVATGSPFAPVSHNGMTFKIGQCNNVFVFPGVGLGIIASGAKEVLPSFFTAAAHAVSKCVSQEAMDRGELLPPVKELREVSLKVAQAVGLTAINANVGHLCAFSDFQHDNDETKLNTLIEKMRWQPEYLPFIVK
ncbi:MAG: NAD-dependent malic enzyme [Desulfobulbaceae bacterium]|nr:NAD-dependent malic enzyme [Desulfobulbaceae bacterium]